MTSIVDKKCVSPYENAGYNQPHKDDIEKFKLLMLSIKDGKVNLLQEYIKNGGDVNLRLFWFENHFCPEITLLMIACQNDYYHIVKILLQQEADIEAQDEYGRTALHYAASNGFVENCSILIQNGANINEIESKTYYRLYGPDTTKYTGTKETALHEACFRGYLNLVKFLLDNGADINSKNCYDQTPIEKCDYLWIDPNDEVLEVKAYLQEYISKRDEAAIIIQTAFHEARYNPEYKMCFVVQMKNLNNTINNFKHLFHSNTLQI